MKDRLDKLLKLFSSNGIDGLLASSWPNVTYLSGFKGSESWLLVSKKERFFITDSRYAEQAENEAVGFNIILRDKKTLAQIVADLATQLKLKKLGFEADIVTHAFYLSLKKVVGDKKLKATQGLVEELRLCKDKGEISQLQKSADIAVKGFHYIKQMARPGMTERDLQGRLEYYTKSIGSEKPAFDIIIATGARSSMPHCQSNQTVVKDNNLVLVDMGVVYNGYYSDLTRPIFLGKIPPLMRKVYDIVWAAQRAGIAKAAPGVSAREVDAACRAYIQKHGYGNFFGHGTGHGVGLEIHEDPSVSAKSEAILKPGMVITVEPGIYLPGKFGIRIEDMVLITKNGHEVLTSDLDKSV